MSDIGSLLGRWHQWRRAYSPERRYARVALLQGAPDDPDDEQAFEVVTMRAIEAEIERMPPDVRLALQHVARAECMGVEVMFSPRLPRGPALDHICVRAVRELERRLVHMGIL